MAIATATLYVCTTCKGVLAPDGRDAMPDAPRPGALLLASLQAQDTPAGLVIKGIECLSACNTGCAVALSAPGKWTYVYGRLDPVVHAADVLAGAALYAQSVDGVVPWRNRPEVFRKQSLARVPPQDPAPEANDV